MPLRYDEMEQVRQMIKEEIKLALAVKAPVAKVEMKPIEYPKKESSVAAETKEAVVENKEAKTKK